MTSFGLLPSTGRLKDYRLIAAECKYRLIDVYLSANLKHTFKSFASEASSVSYIFPLPPDASVHAFTANIDERTIKGIVKEKGEAKAIFDSAVAQKKQAVLLEQANVEIFQISLGNANPGQVVTVQISFVSLVSHEGVNDTLRLVFPTTIAPRYGTAPEKTSANQLLPGKSDTLEFELSAEVNGNITSISSPSHPISSQLGTADVEDDHPFDPSKAIVSLSSNAFLEQDIVLVISFEDLDRPRCVLESFISEDDKTKTDAYALTLVPRFKLPPMQQEYIFLIDRSGSMAGGKMKTVRSALQIMLKSLPNKGTTFNLISFGSSYSMLWSHSSPYTAENVHVASSHVDHMDANMGGTEIKNALLAAFASRAGSITPASVFLLTDGEAWDLQGVQSAIRTAVEASLLPSSFLRVFCMGIGNRVSRAMCDGIAGAGNGSAVYVGENEKLDRKLMKLLRNARVPPVTEVHVDWDFSSQSKEDEDEFVIVDEHGTTTNDIVLLPERTHDEAMIDQGRPVRSSSSGASLTQFPSDGRLKAIVPGTRYSFYAITDRVLITRDTTIAVKLRGTVLGRSIDLEVPVARRDTNRRLNNQAENLIHLLAARAMIRGHEEARQLDQIVQIGLRYSLASSQTSFVAIDEVESANLPGNEESVDSLAHMRQDMSYTQIPQIPSPPRQLPPVPPRSTGFFSTATNDSNSDCEEDDASTLGLWCVRPSFPPAPTAAPPPPPMPANIARLPKTTWMGMKGQKSVDNLRLSSFNLVSKPGALPSERVDSLGAPPSSQVFRTTATRPHRTVPVLMATHPDGSDSEDDVDTSPVRSPWGPRAAGGPTSNDPLVPKTTPQMVSSNEIGDPPGMDNCAEAFARAQAFDGSFSPAQSLCKLVCDNDTLPTYPSVFDNLALEEDAKAKLWCTMLVAVYLEVKLAEEKDIWDILVEKALSWFGETVLEGFEGADDYAGGIVNTIRIAAICACTR